jgi:hypothetical protein
MNVRVHPDPAYDIAKGDYLSIGPEPTVYEVVKVLKRKSGVVAVRIMNAMRRGTPFTKIWWDQSRKWGNPEIRRIQ